MPTDTPPVLEEISERNRMIIRRHGKKRPQSRHTKYWTTANLVEDEMPRGAINLGQPQHLREKRR